MKQSVFFGSNRLRRFLPDGRFHFSILLPFFTFYARTKDEITPRNGKDRRDHAGRSRDLQDAPTLEQRRAAGRHVVDQKHRFSRYFVWFHDRKGVFDIAAAFLAREFLLHFPASSSLYGERDRDPGFTRERATEFKGVIVAVFALCSVAARARNEYSGLSLFYGQGFPDRVAEIPREKIEYGLQMSLFQSVQNAIFG